MRLHAVKKCLGGVVLASLLMILVLYEWGLQPNYPHTWFARDLANAPTHAQPTSRTRNISVRNKTKTAGGQTGRRQQQKDGQGAGFNYVAHKPVSRRIASTNRTADVTASLAALSGRRDPLPSSQGGKRKIPVAGKAGGGVYNNTTYKSAIKSLFDTFAGSLRDPNTSKDMSQVVVDASDIDPRLLWSRTPVGSAEEAACSAHHHLAFLKVHKTGSSTVANIIQRYGFTRRLNFVLPNKPFRSMAYNYINKAGTPITAASILPPPPGGHYDLLWNHAIYNRTVFDSFMPHDTAYVAILREPFQQFLSSFAYYHANVVAVNMTVNPFSSYLSSHPGAVPMGYFRDKQSEDVGMSQHHVANSTLRRHYIKQLGSELNLVMMTEFFDESLVLLRRLMCWSVKDVLYLPKNKNSRRPSLVFAALDYARHRRLSAADYDLYNFFRKKFLRTLQAQGADFAEEVNHFKEVLQQVTKFCRDAAARGNGQQFFVPQSPWSPDFAVSHRDCLMIELSELNFLDILLAVRTQQQALFSPGRVG